MEITEVRIKLMEDSEDRLRAFCSITFDHCFVVRDLKIIDGSNGPFVAMPSRKLTSHCHRCGYKNHLRASYCNQCGAKFRREQNSEFDSPQKLYADVAHPINSDCRERIQQAVIEEFHAELSRSGQPGYRSRYDDEFEEGLQTEPDTSKENGRSAATDQPAAARDGELPRQRTARRPPPKPHFNQRRNDANSSSARDDDNDPRDNFGAGIL